MFQTSMKCLTKQTQRRSPMCGSARTLVLACFSFSMLKESSQLWSGIINRITQFTNDFTGHDFHLWQSHLLHRLFIIHTPLGVKSR